MADKIKVCHELALRSNSENTFGLVDGTALMESTYGNALHI